MSITLTENAISALQNCVTDLQPFVQVIKLISTGDTPRHPHRVFISDSVSYIDAWLPAHYNVLVERNKLCDGSVVRLLQYGFKKVQNLMIMLITEMHICTLHHEIIGPPRTRLYFGPAAQSEPAYQPPALDYRSIPPTPISQLDPYRDEWIIKGRVTAKGSLCNYRIDSGDMYAFHFDLLDCDGGEIRVKCINRLNGVDHWHYEYVEVGNVYFLSKGKLEYVRKENHLRSEWEILLDETSILAKSDEDDISIPNHRFFFIQISDIKNRDDDSILDVIGIAQALEPPEWIRCKDGSDVVQRVLLFHDQTGGGKITLRGSKFCYEIGESLSNSIDSDKYPIFAIKAGRLIDSSTSSLETLSSTQLVLNPVVPEARALKRHLKSDVWTEGDDSRLLNELLILKASCIEDVEWDNLLEDLSGASCLTRWRQLVDQYGERRTRSFPKQIRRLAKELLT